MGGFLGWIEQALGGGQTAAPSSGGTLASAFRAAQAGSAAPAAGAPAAGATASGGAAAATGASTAGAAPAASPGASPGGSGGGSATPPASIDAARSALESTLTGQVYPGIVSQVANAYNGGGGGFLGSLLSNYGQITGGGVGAAGGLAEAAIPGGALLALPDIFGAFMQTLFPDSPGPAPTASDYSFNSPVIDGWDPGGLVGMGPGKTSPLEVWTGKGQAMLPSPSQSYAANFGLTPQELQALGPGVADAYPFGGGAPYTPGSGVYAAPTGMFSGALSSGGFFVPSSNDTPIQTDYFGNPIGPVGGASGNPLPLGSPEPGWLSSDFANQVSANDAASQQQWAQQQQGWGGA